MNSIKKYIKNYKIDRDFNYLAWPSKSLNFIQYFIGLPLIVFLAYIFKLNISMGYKSWNYGKRCKEKLIKTRGFD